MCSSASFFASAERIQSMGKNLKGKECGKGICQRKDGLYYARFVDKTGKRHEKYLPTLPEARNWIEESKYADAHEAVFVATDTTVDQWFDFWIENIVGDLAPNTLRNYRERYVHNIQPVMGKMMIANVKPMHCKKVFIQMDADYAGSTIRQAYITMGTMFKAAKINDLITKHPMDGVRFTKRHRYMDADFVKKNPYICLSVDGDDLIFQITALFITDVGFDYIDPNPMGSKLTEFFQTVEKKNWLDFDGVTFSEEDTVLTLSTCCRKFDDANTGNQRLVVMAKLLPEGATAQEFSVSLVDSPEMP